MILHQTDLDTLEALPFPGIDTLYKAFKRNVQRIGNNDMLGTRVGNEYKWMTWNQVDDKCKHISFGINALDLAPDIHAENQSSLGAYYRRAAKWHRPTFLHELR